MNVFNWSLTAVMTIGMGCAGAPSAGKGGESSAAAIRAAEEVGAAKVPQASLLLQLAKEESAQAKAFAAADEPEKAASMRLRAEADANLAVTLARAEAERAAAVAAAERVRQLRQGGN